MDDDPTVRPGITYAREHRVAIRRDDERSCDYVRRTTAGHDRVAAEIDRPPTLIVKLDPLATLIRNRCRIGHDLVDQDARALSTLLAIRPQRCQPEDDPNETTTGGDHAEKKIPGCRIGTPGSSRN